ncbi:MAG: type VI secretion protein, partial [Pseudomonadota bacterium]
MRLPPKKGDNTRSNAVDPRESESAEIIDLASRSAFPAVTERKSGGDGLQLAAGLAIVAGLGAVTLWSMNAAQTPEPETVGNPELNAAQSAPAPAPAPAPARVPAPVTAPRRPDPAPAPILARSPDSQRATNANPYASPSMVYDASVAANRAVASPPEAVGTATSAAKSPFAAGSAQAFASSIGGVGGAPAQATQMTNPSTTVTQGTLIPAILETAINTDVPGYVRAVVSQDVRSFD